MILTESEYSREAAKDKAERLGFDCIFPKANELFLDLDTEEAYQVFLNQRDLFLALGYPCVYTATTSKSGLPHRHVIVELEFEPTLYQRIALQACLGSDVKRELLSVDAVMCCVEQPTALFKVRETVSE